MALGWRAAEVAQGFARIEERVAAWATDEDAVRAAIIIGSRARDDHPADEWADLDVAVIVADPRFLRDRGWLEAIGEPWISFTEGAAEGLVPELRVLFAGGLDVDFAFIASDAVDGLIEHHPDIGSTAFERGHRVLVDKDGLAQRLLAAVPQMRDQAASATPDADVFADVCGDFWYHTVWTAKHLARGELWWAKSCCDGYLKERLRRVLEWAAAAEERDPWFRGRFLDEWADPDTVAGLRRAFARYDEAEVWAALGVTMDLFAEAARRAAEQLDLAYDETAEEHARELVSAIRATR